MNDEGYHFSLVTRQLLSDRNTMNTVLPSGFVLRPPVVADAQGVADLIAARDMADYGSSDASVEEVQNYWEAPRLSYSRTRASSSRPMV
jgi:hypothetical protein